MIELRKELHEQDSTTVIKQMQTPRALHSLHAPLTHDSQRTQNETIMKIGFAQHLTHLADSSSMINDKGSATSNAFPKQFGGMAKLKQSATWPQIWAIFCQAKPCQALLLYELEIFESYFEISNGVLFICTDFKHSFRKSSRS